MNVDLLRVVIKVRILKIGILCQSLCVNVYISIYGIITYIKTILLAKPIITLRTVCLVELSSLYNYSN